MTRIFEFRVKKENFESLAHELDAQGLKLIQCRLSGLHKDQYEIWMESKKCKLAKIKTPYKLGISYPKVPMSELQAKDIKEV